MTPNGEAVQLHDRLQELLKAATAESLHVVATFIDIRSFSRFAERGGSFDTAYYLRSVYATILEQRFPDRDFFKPTGDGVMLIHRLPEETGAWPALMTSIVTRSESLVDDFDKLTAGDLRVTPPVPTDLGVGIARGHATRLVSQEVTLDYTGPCLNLAARLMDKARPRGVVFRDVHADAMLGEALKRYRCERLCIRGISEDVPIEVYCTEDVVIESRDREPINGSRRAYGELTHVTIAELRKYGRWPLWLPRRPTSDEFVRVDIGYTAFEGDKEIGEFTVELEGVVEETNGGWQVVVPLQRVKELTADTPEESEFVLGLFRTKNKVSFQPYIRPIEE